MASPGRCQKHDNIRKIFFNSKESKPVRCPVWEIWSWQGQKMPPNFKGKKKISPSVNLITPSRITAESRYPLEAGQVRVCTVFLLPGTFLVPGRKESGPGSGRCVYRQGGRKDMTSPASRQVKQPDWTWLLIKGPSHLAGPPGYLLHLFMTTAPRSEINSWWVQTGAQLVLPSPPK